MKNIYSKLQDLWVKENNIKVGDRVKVIRDAIDEELGWYCYKGKCVKGKERKIKGFDDFTGVDLGDFYAPFSVLEKVEEKVTIKLNGEYEAMITERGVTVGCQTFSFDKIEEIYDAVIDFKNRK